MKGISKFLKNKNTDGLGVNVNFLQGITMIVYLKMANRAWLEIKNLTEIPEIIGQDDTMKMRKMM